MDGRDSTQPGTESLSIKSIKKGFHSITYKKYALTPSIAKINPGQYQLNTYNSITYKNNRQNIYWITKNISNSINNYLSLF